MGLGEHAWHAGDKPMWMVPLMFVGETLYLYISFRTFLGRRMEGREEGEEHAYYQHLSLLPLLSVYAYHASRLPMAQIILLF